MLEPKHAGFGSKHGYSRTSGATRYYPDLLERIIRSFLVVCFLGVLGLEIWLLISAFGSG